MIEAIKAITPRPALYLYRLIRDREDATSVLGFLGRSFPRISFGQKLGLVYEFYRISDEVNCPHTQHEILQYVTEILSLDEGRPGVVIEAGCFKGGSTAKFSLACKLAGRKLVVFDSFEGIPENEEQHGENIYGESVGFQEGSYAGSLDEVRANVTRYGAIDQCEFIKGWFDDTMPAYGEQVAAAYLDVDLESSTYTCLRFLYPLLVKGGRIFSQDGHLPLVIAVFKDETFWRDELSAGLPDVDGLGQRKIISLAKT